MLIKEFENGIGFALLIQGEDKTDSGNPLGYTGIDNKTIHEAALVIELYPDRFNITKNRYHSELHRNIPIFLLDDYLEHFGRKFEYRSPILDNFKLEPPQVQTSWNSIITPVIKKYQPPSTDISELFKQVTGKDAYDSHPACEIGVTPISQMIEDEFFNM